MQPRSLTKDDAKQFLERQLNLLKQDKDILAMAICKSEDIQNQLKSNKSLPIADLQQIVMSYLIPEKDLKIIKSVKIFLDYNAKIKIYMCALMKDIKENIKLG